METLESRLMMAADVVINEIMYQATSKSEGDEWIELYNKGDAAANLTGWKFTKGVGYTFGGGTIAAGGYLVVAADVAKFQAKYPGVSNVVGGWTGHLSNSEEELELDNNAGVKVDGVLYSDQGDWAKRRRGALDNNHMGWDWVQPASGGGYTLELINPGLSNNYGQNWGTSTVLQGTPGAVNSIKASNIAPIISGVTQSNFLPKSTDSVNVTATIIDELGTASSASVFYRTDAGAFTQVPMFDDGAHGDGLAGDGQWGGTIPPQADKAVVEFYVSATDGVRTRTWPAPTDDIGTQGANAVYQVDDTAYTGTQPIYRLVMTAAEQADLAQIFSTDVNSNARVNATFIAVDGTGSQIRYLAGVRNRGHGSRSGNPHNFHIDFAADNPWKGKTATNFNARTIYSQVLGSAIWRQAGFVAPDIIPIQVRWNGAEPTGSGGQYALVEEPDAAFAENHFPKDSNGNYYAAFRLDPNLVPEAELTYLGTNSASYSPLYDKKTNSDADDFSDLMKLTDVLNNTPADRLVAEVEKIANLDEWLRYLALDQLLTNRETGLVMGIGDDYGLYRGEVDKRFVLVPHDLDTIMAAGGGAPTASIWSHVEGGVGGSIGPGGGGGVDGLKKLFQQPEVIQRYYAAFLDLIAKVWNPTVMNPLIDQAIGNFASPTQITNMKNFVVNRSAGVLAQIPQGFVANSALPTTADGYKKTTVPATSLSGSANASVTRSVLVNGLPTNYDARTGVWSISTGTSSGGTGTNVQTLIGANAVWKYKDDGSDQGTGWIATGFADGSWATGRAQLGYSDPGSEEFDETTVINGGPVGNHFITTYFRSTFNIANKSNVAALTVKAIIDDGAIIYLNGNAIPAGWFNMATNGVTYTTPSLTSISGAAESAFNTIDLPVSMLVDGTNTIAVEVHQQAPNSSDVSFDLRLEATVGQAPQPSGLIPKNSTWKFLSDGSNQGTAWATVGFNDTGWGTGTAAFGRLNAGLTTTLLTDPLRFTDYFRRHFTIQDKSQITGLTIHLLRDDAAAVWINGSVVTTFNLPATWTYTTPAQVNVGGTDETTYFDYPVNPAILQSLLQNGDNVIAVELHNITNVSGATYDASFDLSMDATVAGGPTTVTGGVPLHPGINRVVIQAFDGFNGTGKEVNRTFVDVFYEGTNNGTFVPSVPVDSLTLNVPAGYRPGTPFLVQVQANRNGQIQRDLWDGTVTLSTDRPDLMLSTTDVQLRNGWGSILVTPTGAGTAAGSFTLFASLGNKVVSRAITSLNSMPVTNVTGTLAGNTTWSGVVHVTGAGVTVPAGATLTVNPGTLVLVDGVASGTGGGVILVNGKLQSLGTAQQPVTFTAWDSALNWGGVRFTNAQPSVFDYTFINKAGNTTGLGHTGTGPAVRSSGTTLTFDHSAITDNVGKAGDMSGSDLTFSYSEISRSRMGPEIAASAVLVDHSWIFDNRSPDDGDGIYLHDQNPGQTITVRHGMIGAVDDDAIDTLAAVATIDDMVLRDAKDKGVSILDGAVTIKNSLLANNSLASEDATFSTISAKGQNNGDVVNVMIDHTTIVANDPQGQGRDVGIESRNKYGLSSGTINYTVTNSIISATKPVNIEAPYTAATIQISYSNLFGTNWAGTGDLNADPKFVNAAAHDYHLKPGSPSVNTGDPAAANNDPDGSRGDQGVYRNGIPGTVPASNNLSGTLSGNTILTPDNGAYTVTGDVVIPAGATLYILPGTSVHFAQDTGITVNGGRIVAEGTQYEQIRFTHTPGTSTVTWDGIQINSSTLDNRISYAVLEYGTAGTTNNGMIGVSSSRVTLDHLYFDHTDRRRLRFNNASIVLTNSEFADIFTGNQAPTTDNFSENIWGSGILPGGQFLIENNVFGTTRGHNDIIDIDGPTRPDPIFVIRNNVFKGGSDDCLDLEGDALIEGNLFQNINRDQYNHDLSNANVLSAGGGHTYTMIRNTIVNSTDVVQVKQNSFLNFINNTVIAAPATNGITFSFDAPDFPGTFGKGAYIDGNIFKGQSVFLASFTNATQITVNRSVVPSAAYLGYGVGNTTEDPRFVDQANGNYALRPGSPALRSGPNGLDMGALVSSWASISGEPPATVGKTSATITVGGPAIVAYKYRLNNGAWSAETPVATPISLSGLTNGSYTVYVVGKNDAGEWQDMNAPTASRTWTVDTTKPSIRVNEVLASNVSAVPNGTAFPDLIELYNHGDNTVNLKGMSITDDPANPLKFVFANDTFVAPGAYLVLYADSKTVAGQIHVGFSLKADGEGVYLFDKPASGGAQIDGVTFGLQLDNLSIGRTADGSWALNQPTFGAANVVKRTGDPGTLKINEWLTAGVDPFADDFIELYNPDPLPIAVGGFYLTDNPVGYPDKSQVHDLSFVPGNAGTGGFARFLADNNPDAGADHTDFGLAAEQGMIGLFDQNQQKIDWVLYLSQRLGISQGRTPDGGNNFSFYAQPNPNLTNPGTTTSNVTLRLTEINYNPPRGSGLATSSDYEFVELKNTGGTTIDLTGVQLTGAVTYTFAGGSLAPGQYVVVVKNQAAFAQRYGSGINVAPGTFADAINDSGGQIRLLDSTGASILDFGFSDAWQPSTDGDGNTLVVVDSSAPAANWTLASNWRASRAVLGTPGIDESSLLLPNPAVVVNEILPYTAGNAGDWIELRNTTGAAIDLSGWYVSNDSADMLKYQLPAGTTIAANGYLVLNQGSSFGGAFSLNGDGGEVYLSSSVTTGALTGYRVGVMYGGTDLNVSLGRHTTSTGQVDFTALSSATPGVANAYPKVGPVTISEIMYHPTGSASEYVELHNGGNTPVDLTGWRFTNGIDLTFPAGTVMQPGTYLLVVPGDANTFRQLYDIPASVQIFGNFQGQLDNSGETVELSRPGVSENGSPDVPLVVVDSVKYGTSAPWVSAPDGNGPSLGRKAQGLYGNDPTSWVADTAAGSAGQAGSTTAPTVAGSLFYVEGDRVTFVFSKDVSASLGVGDLVLHNVTTNADIPAASLTLTWDPATLSATWRMTNGTLPDGDYVATLTAVGITDGASRMLDGNGDGTGGDNYTLAFFKFGGDANRDRSVDFNDLVLLAQNYNTTGGRTWATGDFTGDGNTDFNDLVQLAQHYNTSFPAAGAPVVAAGAVSFSEAWAAAQSGATVEPTVVKTPPPVSPTPRPGPKPVVINKKSAPVNAPVKPVIKRGVSATTSAGTTTAAVAAPAKSPFSTSRVGRGKRDLFA